MVTKSKIKRDSARDRSLGTPKRVVLLNVMKLLSKTDGSTLTYPVLSKTVNVYSNLKVMRVNGDY